jgi:hypothetical protein
LAQTDHNPSLLQKPIGLCCLGKLNNNNNNNNNIFWESHETHKYKKAKTVPLHAMVALGGEEV